MLGLSACWASIQAVCPAQAIFTLASLCLMPSHHFTIIVLLLFQPTNLSISLNYGHVISNAEATEFVKLCGKRIWLLLHYKISHINVFNIHFITNGRSQRRKGKTLPFFLSWEEAVPNDYLGSGNKCPCRKRVKVSLSVSEWMERIAVRGATCIYQILECDITL